MQWFAIHVSIISKLSRRLPSSSTTLPSLTSIPGVGSLGLSIATRPTSTHSLIKPSWFTARFSSTSKRFCLLLIACPPLLLERSFFSLNGAFPDRPPAESPPGARRRREGDGV